MDKDKQIEELIGVALWSIRRLPLEGMKEFALSDLREIVEKEHKYSEFIDKCLGEVIPDL